MKVIQILVRHRDWNVESGLGYGSWTIAAHELPLVIFARNSMVAMTWFLQESCSQLFFFFFFLQVWSDFYIYSAEHMHLIFHEQYP